MSNYCTNEIQQDISHNNNSLRFVIEEIDKSLNIDEISFLFKTAKKTRNRDDSTITLNGAVYPLYCHRGNELIKIPKNWLRDDMLYRAIWSRGGNYWALETMGSLSGGGGGGVTSHTALDDLDIANQHDINVIKVNGTLQFQLPNVETPASASLAGMMRYRETTTNSYIEVCMKTGATTYKWLALAPK